MSKKANSFDPTIAHLFKFGLAVIGINFVVMSSTIASAQFQRNGSGLGRAKNNLQHESKATGSAYGIAKIEDKDFGPRKESKQKETKERKTRPPKRSPSTSSGLAKTLKLPKQLSTAEKSSPSVVPKSTQTHDGNSKGETTASSADAAGQGLKTNFQDPLEPVVEESEEDTQKDGASTQTAWNYKHLTDRENLPSTIQMIISFASISLVPAILLMTTCFIRIVVVLGILRQAIGLQQLPPTQVTTALAILMTFLIMTPTWKQVKENAIDPYSAEGSEMTWEEAWREGVTPVKKFMWRQIKAAENDDDFWLFYDYLPEEEKSSEPESFDDIPLKVMMPAFMISELKVAFLIGAQIFLPFLILDIVVASFSNTMGLIMLPPTVASLPLKLILFVMVDGWNLVVGLLLNSFAPVT